MPPQRDPPALRRRLPDRYYTWRDGFQDEFQRYLCADISVLDIGGGRQPAIAPQNRPRNCHYVGLDVSACELGAAPAGTYDEKWVSDITLRVADLDGRFNLAVSWQVLEHVKSVAAALENIRSYLRPGGRLVASLSGSFSAFALINQILPSPLGSLTMKSLLGRNPDTIFPAYYNRCWHSALKSLLKPWSEFSITPAYLGAVYFGFSPTMQLLYLRYEEWALRKRYANLATQYVISARK